MLLNISWSGSEDIDRLSAESEGVGKGATFILGLPLQACHRRRAAEADSIQHDAARPDFYPLRIFLVEDHKDTLEALRIYLELCGHIVLSARSKAEVLKEIPRANCHVLISDINLPHGSG